MGAGNFGNVHQALLNERSVAIKTLHDEATETEKIKFLQEAAIMGQFSHPNVIQLYGVVSEGDVIVGRLSHDYHMTYINRC